MQDRGPPWAYRGRSARRKRQEVPDGDGAGMRSPMTRPVRDVERPRTRSFVPVPLVVVGPSCRRVHFFSGSPGWVPIERPGSGSFRGPRAPAPCPADRGKGRQCPELFARSSGWLEKLEAARQMRLEPMRRPDALHARMAEADRFGELARRPSWRRRLLVSVMATTRSIVAASKGGLRPGRVASRSPATPRAK